MSTFSDGKCATKGEGLDGWEGVVFGVGVTPVLVHLEKGPVELHWEVVRLEIESHHLTAGAPVRHREHIRRVDASAFRVDARELRREDCEREERKERVADCGLARMFESG